MTLPFHRAQASNHCFFKDCRLDSVNPQNERSKTNNDTLEYCCLPIQTFMVGGIVELETAEIFHSPPWHVKIYTYEKRLKQPELFAGVQTGNLSYVRKSWKACLPFYTRKSFTSGISHRILQNKITKMKRCLRSVTKKYCTDVGPASLEHSACRW